MPTMLAQLRLALTTAYHPLWRPDWEGLGMDPL